MGMNGLGDVSPSNEDYSTITPSGETQNTNNTEAAEKNTSIFARFNDKDGKVDANDVEYLNNAREDSSIANFLSINNAKEWTNTLKARINMLIEKFNFRQRMQQSIAQKRNRANESTNNNSNTDGSLKAKYANFATGANDEFKATKARQEAEAKAFKETSEGKMLEFTSDSKNLTIEFKKNSMVKILNDLKQGYKGAIVAIYEGKSFTISYDKENQTYLLNSKEIDDDTLQEILQEFAEKATSVSGRSEKIQLG